MTTKPKRPTLDTSSDSGFSDPLDDDYDHDWWSRISEMSDEALTTPSKPKHSTTRFLGSGSPTPVMNRATAGRTDTANPFSKAGRPHCRPGLEYANSVKPPRRTSPPHKVSAKSGFERHNSPDKESFSISAALRRPTPKRYIVIQDSDDSDAGMDISDTDPDSPTVSTRNASFTSTASNTSTMPIDSFHSDRNILKAHSIVGDTALEGERTFSRRALFPSATFPSISSLTTPPVPIDDVFGVKPQSPKLEKPVANHPISERDSTSTIHEFLSLPLGTDLDICYIAHNPSIQKCFDEKQIAWGVQWELARGVTRGLWSWDQVPMHIDKLTGTNEEKARLVPEIMLGKVLSMTSTIVCKEVDREQEATMENRGRGLGLMGAWKGDPNWHGGQVQQIGHLRPHGESYKVILEAMEKRRSHRFARFYGSRRILQIRIPKELLENEAAKVKEFLKQKFILLGRAFVAFHCKDNSIYLVETVEDCDRVAQEWCGDQFRMSFKDFMEWHNPLGPNAKQAISKFVTRYSIGLSNTIPVLEFDRDNIKFIDDIYSSDWSPGQGNAPAEKIMTDGCGFINQAALSAITKRMGYEFLPSAIQGRIDGSKGLWLRHPTDDSLVPQIWIRDSQNKIKNPILDRGHRIFELVAPSRPSTGCALNAQTILNLHHNGVSEHDLLGLFEQGLRDEVMPLLDWDNMILLYDAVNKAGRVSGARMQRIAVGASRALGFQRTQWGGDEVESQEDTEPQEVGGTTYTGRNPYSGAPLALHEKLLELIQAGFNPRESKIIQEDLKKAIELGIASAIEKYRVPLKESLSSFVVPDPFAVFPSLHPSGGVIQDPFGVLQEGEIYYRSSLPLKDPRTDISFDILTGDVIVGRYPMRLPSDLQKVTAVNIQELSSWTDVIIASVKGERSLASWLSGGDMDGDYLEIFREPDLVNNFKNKPFTPPPADLANEFERSVESVTDFCSRLCGLPSRDAQMIYQETLLANMKSTQCGMYSMFHENAVSRLGYAHPEAIRLAYIFNELLDASKTGKRLKQGIYENDRKAYGHKPKPYGILKKLREAGEAIQNDIFKQFDAAIGIVQGVSDSNLAERGDPVLAEPYNRATSYALQLHDRDPNLGKPFNEELSIIRKHVDEVHDLFMQQVATSKAAKDAENRSPSKSNKKSRGNAPKSDQQDKMLLAAKRFHEPIPDIYLTRDIDEVKASCAYVRSKGRFPFAVAFRDLCLIKAKAGGIAPVRREFDECKTMSSGAMRALAKSADEIVF